MENARITFYPVQASGKRSGWGKRIDSVDQSKTNGYAFGGGFLPSGQEFDIDVGEVVIQKIPAGSVKNWKWYWQAGIVTAHGIEWCEREYDGHSEFLTFRDSVAALLRDSPGAQKLAIQGEAARAADAIRAARENGISVDALWKALTDADTERHAFD